MDDKSLAIGKELGGAREITGLRCSGVKFPQGVLGGGKVADMVTLVTLITGPLTGETGTTTGTSTHTLTGCYGRAIRSTGLAPVYKFIIPIRHLPILFVSPFKSFISNLPFATLRYLRITMSRP
jgi:hypothetical protein